MIQECLNCVELKKRIVELESRIVHLEGWKGVDKVSIIQSDDEWIVIDHQKDKDSHEVKKSRHIIPHSDVMFLLKILLDFYTDGCIVLRAKQDVWRSLIYSKGLKVELDAFNGGKYRSLFYFKFYYYPLKILEHLGYVDYSGRGKISLTDKMFVQGVK